MPDRSATLPAIAAACNEPTTTASPTTLREESSPADANWTHWLLPRLALLVGGMIAAGTFVVAKAATTRFTPLELSCLRITFSFFFVYAAFRALRGNRPRPAREDLPRLAILGLLGTVVNQMCFLFGISMTAPIHGALLYAFTPAIVLVAAVIWLGEKLSALKLGGIVFAIVGVLIILSARGLGPGDARIRGDLLILVAVFAWAAYTLVGKPVLRRYDPLTVTTYAFGFGAAALLPVTIPVVARLNVAAPGVAGWAGLAYLCILTSGIAFTLWYWALKRMEASQVAIFTNMQPPATALLAWICFGDVPGWPVVGGGVLVLLGITLAQWPARKVAIEGK